MNKQILASIGVFAVIVAGFVLWTLTRNGGASSSATGSTLSSTPKPSGDEDSSGSVPKASTSGSAVDTVAKYDLPDGWREETCAETPAVIYLLPATETLACDKRPVAPVSIALDPAKTRGCYSLSGKTDVRKHTCRTVSINGQQSLQASTEYLASAPADTAGTTVNEFYVPVGSTDSSIIRATYTFKGTPNYQQQFETIVQSIRSRS